MVSFSAARSPTDPAQCGSCSIDFCETWYQVAFLTDTLFLIQIFKVRESKMVDVARNAIPAAVRSMSVKLWCQGMFLYVKVEFSKLKNPRWWKRPKMLSWRLCNHATLQPR